MADRAGLAAAKQGARKDVKAALRALSPEEMGRQSEAIAAHVQRSQLLKDAGRVGVYVTCAKLCEVDTAALLREALRSGSRCYVPLVDDQQSNMRLLHTSSVEELVPAPPFGILEPPDAYPDGSPREDVMKAAGPLRLLLMPGLAFDSSGNRLGRGGGYYDKFVAQLQDRHQQQGWEPPLLVGLSFSVQLLQLVPAGPQDQRVDVIVTPDGVHACTPRGQLAAAAAGGLPG